MRDLKFRIENMKRTNHLRLVMGFVGTVAVLASSCVSSLNNSPRDGGRRQTPTLESQLAAKLHDVQPWGDSIEYTKASWDNLLTAARLIQENDPQHVEQSLQKYQLSCDRDDDGKLLILLRVVFALPEDRPLGDVDRNGWVISFGGWMHTDNTYRTNAAWPISWSDGSPKLVARNAGLQGPAYDAAQEFHYLRGKYPMRDLGVVRKDCKG
jgi:hypothetical protein